jgi:hypothetical protein
VSTRRQTLALTALFPTARAGTIYFLGFIEAFQGP